MSPHDPTQIETEGGTYPDELKREATWMFSAKESKTPVNPASDNGYKWSDPTNYLTFDRTDEIYGEYRKHGMVGRGRVFIFTARSPFMLVDGDNTICPETGEMHPDAERALDILGDTYVSVSQSGSGFHAAYEGSLPNGEKQAVVQLDDEPWGENEEPPKLDIFSEKKRHIAVLQGERVTHFSDSVCETDPDNFQTLYDDYERTDFQTNTGTPNDDADSDRLPEDYVPTVSIDEDATSNIDDIFYAIEHIDAERLCSTQRVGSDSTGWETWNPDTYRMTDSGESLHSPPRENVFHDFETGESFGVLSLFACEQGIINYPWQELSGDDFWEAVEQARDAGASIPEFQPATENDDVDIEFGAIIPDDPHDGFEPRDHELGGAIRQEELYSRVENTIKNAITGDRDVLIDALMSAGKTYSSAKVAHELEANIAYFAPRIDLYEQFKDYCLDVGIPEDEILVLPSIKRDCPTWQGEHGDEWEAKVKHLYEQGATPKAIHVLTDIPCEDDHGKCQAKADSTGERCENNAVGSDGLCSVHGGEHEDGRCPYRRLWDFDPDDYQVIIGNHKHAHIEFVTAGRTCFFDEDPGDTFTTQIEGERLIESINTYLSFAESPPVEDFDDLLAARSDPSRVREITAWYEHTEFDWEPDSQNTIRLFDKEQQYHAYAPHAVWSIAKTEPIEEGCNFEITHLPGVFNEALFFTTSDEHPAYTVEVRKTPNLDYTRNVIALDGTPLVDESRPELERVPEWVKGIGTPLEHKRVMSDEERGEYLETTLNHTYVQTSEYRKPYSSGKYNDPAEDASLLKAVTEEYGQGEPPVVVTSKKVADEYRGRGFEDAGYADEFVWPQALRGSDEYGERRVGVQLGSSHYGDHYIRRRAAWLRETVDVTGRGNSKDYGSAVGNKVFEQIGEKQTLQNVLRFGRDGDGAVVVLHTSAFPDWLPIHGTGSAFSWAKGMRQVQAAFEGAFTGMAVSKSEIAEVVDISERQVYNVLCDLSDMGLVDRERDRDDGRRILWRDDGVSEIEFHGQCELASVDTSVTDESGEVVRDDVDEISRYGTITSDFTNLVGTGGDDGGSRGDGGRRGGGGPPNDVDW